MVALSGQILPLGHKACWMDDAFVQDTKRPSFLWWTLLTTRAHGSGSWVQARLQPLVLPCALCSPAEGYTTTQVCVFEEGCGKGAKKLVEKGQNMSVGEENREQGTGKMMDCETSKQSKEWFQNGGGGEWQPPPLLKASKAVGFLLILMFLAPFISRAHVKAQRRPLQNPGTSCCSSLALLPVESFLNLNSLYWCWFLLTAEFRELILGGTVYYEVLQASSVEELETLEGWLEMCWSLDTLPSWFVCGILQSKPIPCHRIPAAHRWWELALGLWGMALSLCPYYYPASLWAAGVQRKARMWVRCSPSNREAKYGSRYGLDVEKGKSNSKRANL